MKTETVRPKVSVPVGVKICVKLSFRRCLRLSEVGVEKFHFLAQSPTNDEIILIQPQCLGLAVQDLFLYEIFGQALQFLMGRQAHPGAFKLICQSQGLSLVDDNPIRGCGG